jgi:hypothetical protein
MKAFLPALFIADERGQAVFVSVAWVWKELLSYACTDYSPELAGPLSLISHLSQSIFVGKPTG